MVIDPGSNLAAVIMTQLLIQQLRALRPVLFCLYGPAAIFLTVLAVLCFSWGIPFSVLTRDIADTAGVHPLTGMVSSIGMWFWSGAVAICAFGWFALKGAPEMRQRRSFFGVFGALTLVLLADDLFMLHETLIPRHLSISDRKVLLMYMVVFPLTFWLHRAAVARTSFVLVALSALCFGFSIFIDETHDYFVPDSIHHLLEDGAKLLGIISWAAYFFVTCLDSVRPRLEPEPTEPA
jgi:hypothetical protein